MSFGLNINFCCDVFFYLRYPTFNLYIFSKNAYNFFPLPAASYNHMLVSGVC